MKAAVSAGGLAEAMARTANSARLAGVGMDELLGYMTVVGEVTQRDMSTVGEAFKTIFARYSNVKLGRLVDDEGESLNDFESSLNLVGISLRDQSGQFRAFGEVLRDIGEKYDKLDNIQKSAIATSLGSTRQRENVLVLLENLDKAFEYTEVAANSSGTALEKFGIYEESLAAKSNNLAAAFENLTMVLFPDEVIAGAMDLGTAILDFLTGLNGVPLRVGAATTSILALIAAFKTLSHSSFATSFKDITHSLAGPEIGQGLIYDIAANYIKEAA